MSANDLAVKYGTYQPENLLIILPLDEASDIIRERLRAEVRSELESEYEDRISDAEEDASEWESKSDSYECDAIRSAHPQPLGPVMDAAIDAFNAEEMPETGMLNAYFILRDSITVKTTQVDAFLAEVRASGVEMFGQYHNFSEKLFIQKEAQKFAAQLRKGVRS